ncbi:MAG TPA: CdaR family protein, partial [Roseiflexaceae bacterium]|nr:CdaR family protein [Roseiflexaceae bacterium]
MTTLRAAILRVIMATLLAFALWVFVSYTQNPDVTSSFDSVPVEIEGLAPGVLVVDKDGQPRTGRPTVDLTVDADEETLRNLTVSDLRAFVDVSGRGPGEHSVPINVVPTRSGLQRARFSANPDFLLIRLDQEITRTVPLTVEITGSVPFGFEAGEPEVTVAGRPVTEVRVRGPQGRVERVVQARISADIDRLTANYNSSRTPEAVGADGQVVEGVTIDPPTVNLEVPISSSVGVKRVPVVPQLTGLPASGYVVTGVSVEPQLVTLTGSSGPLDAVESVSTFVVSVGGASQTFTRTVAIAEPVNTRLGFGEPTSAVVTVQIAPIARPFQVTLPVAVQVVDIPPGLLTSLSPQVVQVDLAGTAAQLGALDPATLVATVSANGLSPGVHRLTPVLQLPEGLRLVREPPAVTVTLRAPPT